MCISLEVSIGAAVLNAATCGYLFLRNEEGDRFLSVSLGYIGTMQWLEAAMWMDQSCGTLNRTATEIAKWQNSLQPLVFLACAYFLSRKGFKWWMCVPFVLVAYFTLPNLLTAETGCSLPCEGGKGEGLSWKYTATNGLAGWLLFAVSLSVPLLSLPGRRGVYFFTASMVVYAAAMLLAKERCDTKGNITAGSLWCLLGSAMPLLGLAV